MKRILIVEDDMLLNKTLAYNLSFDGYEVTGVMNAREARGRLDTESYDLLLLDVNLPDGNGFEICRDMQKKHKETMVIFLTVNEQERDVLKGYEAGAVDYITKPFSIEALQKKIAAMFRMLDRHQIPKDIYDDGRLILDFSGQSASLNGVSLSLSAMEYRTLQLFCQNPKLVLTRQQLLEKLWDVHGNFVDEHTLTTAISRIRSKIEVHGDTYIKTVYGMGYLWTGGEQQ